MSFSSNIANISHEKYNYDAQNKTLNGVPIWNLFIDKNCHSRGEMAFDQGTKDQPTKGGEKGYAKAMHAAFDYILTNPHKKMDADEFLKIHSLCIHQVKNIAKHRAHEGFFHPACYDILTQNVSAEAKHEWASEKLIETFDDYLMNMKNGDGQADCAHLARVTTFSRLNSTTITSASHKLTHHEITQKVNEIFHTYYAELASSKDDETKLQTIVSLCRKLEIGHFFSDGNQRTIVFILLNKLLIENGFCPTILDDPIVFDGYKSQNQLVEEVKNGQEYFLYLKHELSTHKKEDNAFPVNCALSQMSAGMFRPVHVSKPGLDNATTDRITPDSP